MLISSCQPSTQLDVRSIRYTTDINEENNICFSLIFRSNQELVEQSFLQIMRTLFDAPDASPLAEVDPISVVELMVQLTSLRNREDHLKSIDNRQNIDQVSLKLHLHLYPLIVYHMQSIAGQP